MWPSLEEEQKQFYFQAYRHWISHLQLVPSWPSTNVSVSFMNKCTMKIWGIAPCSLVEVERRSRFEYCFHHQPDNGGSTQLWNVGSTQRDHTALYPRRLSSSYSTPRETEILQVHNDCLCMLYLWNYLIDIDWILAFLVGATCCPESVMLSSA
jgi:hypothetical protein